MAHPQPNYEPDPTGSETIVPLRFGSMGNLHGSGDPNGTVNGRAGWSYYDDATGDLYINTGTGYNSTWTAVSAGGGGSTQVFRSASSNPVADPGVSAAIHYREDTGNIWAWNDTLGQWDQIL